MSEKLNCRITGVSPLIMHNGQLANPLNRFSKAIKEISGKRAKTEADYEEMARLEWLGGLYVKNGIIVLPGMNVEATFLASARKRRKGKQAQAGVICPTDAPLQYDGSGLPEDLWPDERFRFTTIVRIKGSRIVRTRPMFENWSAEVEFLYDPSLMNHDDMLSLWIDAGQHIGICDWRPKFGRFEVKVI